MIRLLCAVMLLSPVPALSQGMSTSFGAKDQDTNAPIEVTAERLEVNDNSRIAIFTGEVVVTQDQTILHAPRVEVTYVEDNPDTVEVEDGIERVFASGGVRMFSGDDAAEGQTADYVLSSEIVVMKGDALIRQGRNVVTGETADINLAQNTALMRGRVRTIINPGESK